MHLKNKFSKSGILKYTRLPYGTKRTKRIGS